MDRLARGQLSHWVRFSRLYDCSRGLARHDGLEPDTCAAYPGAVGMPSAIRPSAIA